jgi:hypothetical protein
MDADFNKLWAAETSDGRFTGQAGYNRVAGEVEARDVQSRADFTPEQRAATAPYTSQGIAPEDMIVLNRGGGVQASAPSAAKWWQDESGQPPSFDTFHGTARDFDRFDSSYLGENTPHDPGARFAHFFADNEGDAWYYAARAAERQGAGDDGTVMRLRLSPKNPLVLDAPGVGNRLDDETFSSLVSSNKDAILFAKQNGYDAVYLPHGDDVNTPGTWMVWDEDLIAPR